MPREPVRFLDLGPLGAGDNTALDEVLLRARDGGEAPDTFRVLRYRPACVLIGRYQDADQEVRWDYCQDQGIEVERRVTGGGAIYFGELDWGWEVVGGHEFRARFPGYRLAEVGVRALEKLGVPARFRPRNDIEVGGRKISGTGGVEERNAFLFQGTLLVDLRPEVMMRSLRVPTEKLARREIVSLRERVTSLTDELATLPSPDTIRQSLIDAFEEVTGRRIEPGSLTEREKEAWRETRERWRREGRVNSVNRPGEEKLILTGTGRTVGGLIRVHLAIRDQAEMIDAAVITGDFFASPLSGITGLEAALKFCRASPERVADAVNEYFARSGTEIRDFSPRDLVELIVATVRKARLLRRGFTAEELNHLFPVLGEVEDLLDAGFSLVLLPYCAKRTECEERYRSGCRVCGQCTVGTAWEDSTRRGKRVRTIQSYEELEETLWRERAAGGAGFLGSCCEAFYAKHLEDFARIGLPGLLVGVTSRTCYDLGKYREAHEGRFENQTSLDMDLLRRVMEARQCSATS